MLRVLNEVTADSRNRGVITLELSDRKEKILSAIIEQFIATGEPVGSKLLAEILPMTVSSATIRNEMAFLSENGFLSQPHTSAGRIPADKGYRYYIEKLLMNYAPSDADMFRISSAVDFDEGDPAIILKQACNALSEQTGCAVAASTPSSPDTVISGVNVIPLGENCVMTIVSTSAGAVKSRTVKASVTPDYDTLKLFYKIVESSFANKTLVSIGPDAIQSVCASLGSRFFELIPLIAAFSDCVNDAVRGSTVVAGAQYLSASPALRQDAVSIMRLLYDENELPLLLSPVSDSPVEMSIGNENEYGCLRHAAFIRAKYSVPGGAAGAIGIIAPTKTDYSGIIPLLKYTGECVEHALSTGFGIN